MPGAARTDALSARIEELAGARTRANARFFEAEAERLARCCHAMAERFARGGRLIALGHSPVARSDARHVAVEFVHPVIVGKRALPAIGLAGEGGDVASQLAVLAERDDIVIAYEATDEDTAESREAAGAGARAGLSDHRLRRRRGRVGVPRRRGGPLHRAGDRGDALSRAVGAGARLLRPSRPAGGPRGAPGPRHGRFQLPVSLPVRVRARPRRRARRRPPVGVDEVRGGRRPPRGEPCATTARSCSRPQPSCAGAWTGAGACWRSATAARPPTRWTWSPTSGARRTAGRRAPRWTSPRTRRS